MKLNRSDKLILTVIFFLAFVLRFYKLSEYPVGFHGDEASLSYNAYSILLTGKDENGDFLPLHSYISKTYRPIGYTYLDIFPVKFLGLNEFAARFPSAFFGSLTVICIFFLSHAIFSSISTAFLTAFLLTISPWHINLSRSSTESLVALFFVVCGFCCLLSWFKNKKNLNLLLPFLIFIASFVIYPAPRIFTPLLIIFTAFYMFIFNRRNYSKKSKILFFVFFNLLMIVDFLLVFTAKGGMVKFGDVGIFSYQEPLALLGESIREESSSTSPFITRFFHNKIKSYSSFFIAEYFKYFNFNYLVGGGIFPLRYRIPHTGLLYLIELPFLFIGVFKIFRSIKYIYFFPIFWLIVGPIASSLTWEDTPNILRSLPMLPALTLITAFGIVQSFKGKKLLRIKKYFIAGFFVILFYSVLSFLHQYFVHARVNKPWHREYGYKELVNKLQKYYLNYDQILITKSQPGSYIHLLYYLKFDPNTYQKLGSPKDADYKGFDKFIFVPNDCLFPDELIEKHHFSALLKREKVLYIINGICDINYANARELDTIYRPDNSPVFKIVDYNFNNET